MLGLVESDLYRFCLALIGSAAISFLAYKLQALSITGAISAFVMGMSFVFFGEPIWFALLITFFASSTFWSMFKKRSRRKKDAEQHYEKTGKRDAWQVFANGGIGMLLCIGSYFQTAEWLLVLYIMVMAIVNADTWATEIGSLSRSKPRHVLTGKRVETGTSGGITLLGTFAALSGAVLIGAVSALLSGEWIYIVLATCAGFVGCMLDSLLGATLQRMYRCQICGQLTEKSNHCGKKAAHAKGLLWINNDVVNVSASLLGSLLVWFIYNLI